MNTNSVDDHKCNTCNKIYSSYQSLWKHNKIYHKNITKKVTDVTEKLVNVTENGINIKKYICNICSKEFNHRQNKYEHEKICKNNKSKEINELTQLVDKQNELIKNEIELAKLKLKIQSSKKLDTKTFKSLNKALKERTFLKMQNSNINSHNTNNIQNNIINNNIQLIGFSKEEVINTITNKEKSQIMANGYQCLEKFIEITNIGKYDQFKNIIITNIKDPYAYKFDDKQGFFVTCNKTEVLNELVNNRVTDIEAIYNEFDEANKINDKTKKIICNFLAQINDTQKPYVEQNENRTYENYFDFKVHKIKILLFDNQDKITKDIALFIEEK